MPELTVVLVLNTFLINAAVSSYTSQTANTFDYPAASLYKLVRSVVRENLFIKKQQYFGALFFLFFTLLAANVIGMLPYSFTITSSFIVTLFLAPTHFVGINHIATVKHQWGVTELFLPSGAPPAITPMLVMIENASLPRFKCNLPTTVPVYIPPASYRKSWYLPVVSFFSDTGTWISEHLVVFTAIVLVSVSLLAYWAELTETKKPFSFFNFLLNLIVGPFMLLYEIFVVQVYNRISEGSIPLFLVIMVVLSVAIAPFPEYISHWLFLLVWVPVLVLWTAYPMCLLIKVVFTILYQACINLSYCVKSAIARFRKK